MCGMEPRRCVCVCVFPQESHVCGVESRRLQSGVGQLGQYLKDLGLRHRHLLLHSGRTQVSCHPSRRPPGPWTRRLNPKPQTPKPKPRTAAFSWGRPSRYERWNVEPQGFDAKLMSFGSFDPQHRSVKPSYLTAFTSYLTAFTSILNTEA